MESLLRTQVERFEIKDSLKLSEVETHVKEHTLDELIVPIDKMFENLKAVTLTAEATRAVCNGNAFRQNDIVDIMPDTTGNTEFFESERIRVYGEAGNFIAIYVFQKDAEKFKIVRMFFDGREQ